MTYPALSFWQPYAWLIVNGHASVDSRMWAPPQKYIGERIAIHASKKKMTKSDFKDFLGIMKDLKIKNYPRSPADFDYGFVVGTVKIDEISKDQKSYFAHPGYFHWVLSAPKKIKPFAQTGMMGWFRVEID